MTKQPQSRQIDFGECFLQRFSENQAENNAVVAFIQKIDDENGEKRSFALYNRAHAFTDGIAGPLATATLSDALKDSNLEIEMAFNNFDVIFQYSKVPGSGVTTINASDITEVFLKSIKQEDIQSCSFKYLVKLADDLYMLMYPMGNLSNPIWITVLYMKVNSSWEIVSIRSSLAGTITDQGWLEKRKNQFYFDAIRTFDTVTSVTDGTETIENAYDLIYKIAESDSNSADINKLAVAAKKRAETPQAVKQSNFTRPKAGARVVSNFSKSKQYPIRGPSQANSNSPSGNSSSSGNSSPPASNVSVSSGPQFSEAERNALLVKLDAANREVQKLKADNQRLTAENQRLTADNQNLRHAAESSVAFLRF
jgi:hypothetical protein